MLDLAIATGRPVLAAVNGMTAGDELHTCVRDRIRGLTFPVVPTPKNYTVTIDLGPEMN